MGKNHGNLKFRFQNAQLVSLSKLTRLDKTGAALIDLNPRRPLAAINAAAAAQLHPAKNLDEYPHQIQSVRMNASYAAQASGGIDQFIVVARSFFA